MRDKEKVKKYNKEYRIKNKDKVKQLQYDYYHSHREKRIENARNWTIEHKEKALHTRREYMKTPVGRLTSVKGSAKVRGIDYKLSDKDAIEMLSTNCAYCGNDKSIGIDRIDSNIGYIKDNCVPCCSMCNYMKREYKQIDFINQCKKIAKFLT